MGVISLCMLTYAPTMTGYTTLFMRWEMELLKLVVQGSPFAQSVGTIYCHVLAPSPSCTNGTSNEGPNG